MDSASAQPKVARFGPFEADLYTQELRKHGIRLRLPNQSFLVLSVLLERPGQMVTREELRTRLWPSDTFVEYDQGLNAAVNRLREALGDSADNPRFIETLPRRGYRFIASIESDTAGRVDRRAAESTPASSSLTCPAPTAEPPPATATANPPVVGSNRRFHPKNFGTAAILVLLALLLSVALIRWKRSSGVERFGSVRPVPFTSLPGLEVAPAFSPDGSQIVYAWKGPSDSGFDLYVKTVGSERTLRLTHHPSRWISPAWSPDGSQIAFSRWSQDDSGIFVIPALGGPERKLASAEFWYEPLMQISWSPDAKSLAFWSTGQGGSHAFLLPLDTLQPRILAPELQCWDAAAPVFSPDGKNVALTCTSSIAVYAIYIVSVSGGPPRLLASLMGYPRGVAWSSDGTRVFFSNDSGDGGELWQADMGGRAAKLPFGEGVSFPAVAAQGDRFAYARGSTMIDVWRIDLTAPKPENSAKKILFSTLIQRDHQFSPDGTKIVFDSNRSGSPEIWLADAEGNNPVQLTFFKGTQTGGPSWCSDGQRVAFDSRASGLSAIYVEHIQERLPRRIQTNVQNLALPTWSADCRWLYVSDGNSTLYRIPSAGGEATRVTGHPSYYSFVSGNRVFFNVKGPADVELWSKPTEGDSEAPLRNMPRLTYSDAWTVASTGIYYSDSAVTAIRFYDFTSQTTKQVAKLKQAPTPAGGLGLSVSPDGHWLLYTQTDDEQSDIMLVEHMR